MLVGEIRMLRLELPDLAIGAPPSVAGSRISQVSLCDPLEATSRVELRGELQCKSFMVDELVDKAGADGLVIEALRIQLAPFDTRDLRTHQGGAVVQIRRAIHRPFLKLPVVNRQRIEVLLSFVVRCGVPGGRMGHPSVEMTLSRFEPRW